MIRSKGANYIGATERPRVRSLKTKITTVVAAAAAAITVFMGIGVGALAADSASTHNVTAASAGLGISCTEVLGGNMDKRAPWGSGPLSARLFEDLKGRTLTLSEIVGAPAWTNYTGIGDGPESDMFVKPYSDVIDPLKLNNGAFDDGTGEQSGTSARPGDQLAEKYSTNWGEVSTKLQGERNTGNCFWEQTFLTNTANGVGLGLANVMQMFVTWVSTTAFNSSFICDPDSPASDCIDLVKIIGGRDDASYRGGGDGGIIGDLTNSIYKPLVLIVVIVTALGVAWTGLVKRKFREALTQTVWLIVSFVIGLAILLNPSMLAKAPMVATNAVTGCVIGAFNGVNCFSGSGFSSDTSDGVALTADSGVCISKATGAGADQITALAVNSMGCTIWKTFILQNYAKGAFGVNLDQLEVNKADTVASEAVTAAGISPSEFCFTLQTNGSIDDYDGGWLETRNGGNQICNLAVYNMLMQMKVTPYNQTASATPADYDPAWYDLIVTTASSDKMWPIWTNGGAQFAQGGIAVISVFLGGILIVVASVAALMYYITAIILLIFAPLFILIGINPGRGKKLMLGWLETILASILKYLASAIFLLVALALYSAVLGAADPMAALLFVAILSMVLWMYRKEIVETFSKVSLGGERMANMMDKQIPIMGASGRQLSDKAAKVPGAIVGGAVGGVMAGGMKNLGTGIATATQNELRSAPGLVGRAAQARERQLRDNKSDFGRTASRAKDSANRAAANAETQENDAERAMDEYEKSQASVSSAENQARLADDAVEGARDELRQTQNERVAATAAEETINAELQNIDMQAAFRENAVHTVADEGASNGNFSAAAAEFRKLQSSIELLGVNARIADLNGDTRAATQFRIEQRDDMRQMTAIEKANTATPELRNTWDAENKEFDRMLRQEQMQYEELRDETGTGVREYDPEAHYAVAERAMAAKNASMEIDQKNQANLQKIDRLEEAAEDKHAQVRVEIDATADAQIRADSAADKARTARIEAEAQTASADSLFQAHQDLGPGNLPTGRDMKTMERKAFKDGQEVKESYEQLDKIAQGDDDVAPRRTVGQEAGAAIRDLGSVVTTGSTLDERAAQANEKLDDAAAKRQEATQRREAFDQAATERAERVAEARREARSAVATQAEAAQDASMREDYAETLRKGIRAEQEKLEKLEVLRTSGTKLRGPDGNELSTEESEKLIQERKQAVEAELATKSNAAEAVFARAEKAKAELEAANARLEKAQAEHEKAKAGGGLGAAREKLATTMGEANATRKESRAAEKAEKRNEASGRGNFLTKDSVKIPANPKTEEESSRKKSLEQLVTMAESLSKAPNSAPPQTIEALQAEIMKIAKNVETNRGGNKNRGSNESMIRNLAETVSKLVPQNTDRKNPPGGGLPTRPRG